MATTMGVNPNTMARAYQELEREGFIETRRGEGSYVTGEPGRIDDERKRLAEAAVQQFSEQIRDLGLTRSQTRSLLERIDEEAERS
jgi:GntR family transcriptional regulator